MISSTSVLLAVILLFWGLWVAIAAATGRSWLPVVATIPWVVLGFGLLLNRLADWAGTITVVVLHVLIAGNMVWNVMRRPRTGTMGEQADN